MDRAPGDSSYVEGERVFAPPQGSFDLDWAASLAAERLGRPVDREALLDAVRDAWTALRTGTPSATEDPELAAAAAAAVRDFITAYAVEP
ncbi:hypothetical protein EV189_0914 [Motilibacter rhizosphaerae]|uniref:Uncharacterized protein n=1 Tax=Motilibacter rhizosphaerae TaxID=598652 RepID=A0A4Q7NWU2_9ACTN|nr:hypothetical protein [Motilibacter rhizosphaerae]RZS91667.1 hypothetical protein EV189_0914 [Motilibacter rhizosphaerae]